ncbi:MAG TPA: membrane dipeptidase [Solirubrobacterales bacterium]|nr:membrane dipeptidase [Solirubrobacterales bacterium]
MLADMHCHYPMHLAAQAPKEPWEESPNLAAEVMTARPRRPEWVEKLRAGALKVAANHINFGDDRWRVSLNELEGGDVRAVYSVLYEPFAELDLDEPYGAAPEQGYFDDLIGRLDGVESDLEEQDPSRSRCEVVKSSADLDRVVDAGKIAFMHCVEGGFHLGGDPDEISERVKTLKERGVVYITLAHLFWRQVATNAPALPFLSDGLYRRLFRQPDEGLGELGAAAVRAMYEQRMLIDLSHMSERALDDTFRLLGELDKESGAEPTDHPVVATHAGYRLGSQEYMLSPATVHRVAARGGVVGLILARHQLCEKADVQDPDDPAETPRVLRRHIDAIRQRVPGQTNAHVAIGSDLDGFIKPTMPGIETASDLATLEAPLRATYGDDAEMILCGNAMRVARWALG